MWVFDEPTVTHGYNWGVDKRKPSAHRHHRVAKFTTYTKGTRAIRHTTFVTLGIDAHLWYGIESQVDSLPIGIEQANCVLKAV